MRILQRITKEVFYMGLSEEEFHQVKVPVGERNRNSVIYLSATLGMFWLVSLFLYRTPEYASTWIVFRTAFVLSLITMLSGIFLIKRFPQLLLPSMYLLEFTTLGTGIGLAVAQPEQRIATLVAAITIVPTFFIDRTYATFVVDGVIIVIYMILGKKYISPDVYSWGIETTLIFTVAGLLIGHNANKTRFERYVYADSVEKLADIQKSYNDELQKDVEAKTEKIVALHEQFVLGMATMVESRDNSTGSHIMRTSTGVRILIEEIRKDNSLHLSDAFCEKVIKAAPMHDLGKIAVDDAILRKPGRFTPEEYAVMKKHAAEGLRIVHQILKDTDDAEFRQIAENIAHYHHERVDGTGYPEQLKGDEIPLEARIMAIADVYDALVSKRAYKDCFSFEKANQIIMEGMGTQFDPDLKKYYEAARPKLEAYYKKEFEDM